MTDIKTLIKNCASSPITPNHYGPLVLSALGGTLDLGDATSRQGGTNIQNLRWENNDLCYHQTEILLPDNLVSYCRRNDLFWVAAPVEKQVSFYINALGKHTSIIGKTFCGTFAAALIQFRHFPESTMGDKL